MSYFWDLNSERIASRSIVRFWDFFEKRVGDAKSKHAYFKNLYSLLCVQILILQKENSHGCL